MERTTATGSVSGFYEDKDVGLGKPGTKIIALDKNNIQEEIIASIERAGIDLSTDRFQAVDSFEIIRKPVQSIIAGKIDANGEADYLTESAGVIGIDTSTGSDPFIASCADGYNISKVANRQTRIYYDSDQANLWDLSAEANDDYYLFLDIDASDVITAIFSTLAPIYDYAFPTTPGTGQFFYQLTSNKVYVWSGSTWEQKIRVYVGRVNKAAGPVYTLYPQKITIEYGRYNVFGDGNLNIEADSAINQDLTTDATAQLERLGLGRDISGDSVAIKASLYDSTGDAAFLTFQNSDTGIGLTNGFLIGIEATEQVSFINRENTDMVFLANNIEKMRIKNTGEIIFDEGTGIADLQSPSGDMVFSPAGTEKLRLETTGELTTPGNTVFQPGGSEQMRIETDGELYVKAGISSTDGQPVLKEKIIDIGDWDMNNVLNISVLHGLSNHKKIRRIYVVIRSDADTVYYNLEGISGLAGDYENQGGINQFSTTSISLYRKPGGVFDSTSFETPPGGNRGWVYITYEV